MLTRDEIKQYTLKHLARGREVNRLREDFDERKLEAVIGERAAARQQRSTWPYAALHVAARYNMAGEY